MNKVVMVGRIVNDIETRTTQSGVTTCSFRIAVQRRFRNAEGNYDSDFFNVVAWRGTAEYIAKYFGKGQRIGIVGSLQSRSYDAQDGSKRYVTEIIVDEAEFVESKREGVTGAGNASGGGYEEVEDSDLPF